MVCQYKKICKDHHCRAKVFTQMSGNLKDMIGSPDLLILFTNTVSHKMVRCAVNEAEICTPKCANHDKKVEMIEQDMLY